MLIMELEEHLAKLEHYPKYYEWKMRIRVDKSVEGVSKVSEEK